MSTSTNRFGYMLVLCWVVFTCAAFAYFTFERIAEFDPEGLLADTSRQEFVDSILQSDANIGVANTLIHFTQAGCSCNTVSQRHINALNLIADKNNIGFIDVEVDNSAVVPSTPSIAILDDGGELIYYGPYGEGLGCTQTNGFALTVLNNHLKGYSANLMVTSAKGCYCNT